MNSKKLRMMRALATAALSCVGFTAAGCGGEELGSAGVGAATDGEVPAGADESAGSLHGDLMATAHPSEDGVVQSALSSSRDAGEPKVFYLDYADGTELPKTDINACKGTAPKFKCKFASTLAECQRQIQAYLDKWYADFNIIFTLTRPTSGKFYTEVISSGGGDWCGVDSKVAGIAPFLCKDIQGGVSYTFSGGNTAKETAVIIAQEQAHLVGLEHTKSDKDLMHPTICRDCDGFVDEDLAIDGDRCDRKSQNSYQMMKERLGAWPGGPKPSAFGCMTDETVPGLTIMEPVDGATVGHNFVVRVEARDDCDLSKVQVAVSPQTLSAESRTPPFEWDLTSISGRQIITVTATDGVGHVARATVTVNAPADVGGTDSTEDMTAGCTVASGAFSVTGLLPSAAMLALFLGRRHARRRRRLVTGALARKAAAAASGVGGTSTAFDEAA